LVLFAGRHGPRSNSWPQRVSSTQKKKKTPPATLPRASKMSLPSQVANMPVCDASPSGISRPRLTRFESTHDSAFNLSPRSSSRGGRPDLLSPSVGLSYSGKTGPRSTLRCAWGSNASAAGSLRRVSKLYDSGTLNQCNCGIHGLHRSPSLGFPDTCVSD